MDTLAALAPFAPLAQTLLWVGLVLVLVAWFNGPIRTLLAALNRRVESGSTLKAGWFELSDQLKPLPPEAQREKAKQELAEIAAQPPLPNAAASSQSSRDASEQYFLTEDLALRAVQADLGVPLNRQLSAGPDVSFDAAFVKGGTLHVVEVKHFMGSVTPEKLRASLDKIAHAVAGYAWRNVKVVVVLVYKRAEDIESNADRVRTALGGYSLPFEVRSYSLPELLWRFGGAPNAA